MQNIRKNLLYDYSLINPCEKHEDCVAPYGYKHAMTLSPNTERFAVSQIERNRFGKITLLTTI